MKKNITPKGHSLQAWVVVFSGTLFFFYEFLQMNMLNAISIGLMRDFSFTSTQLAFLSDTYLIATILFLLPSGLILDRFLPRTVLLTTLSIAIAGTIVFSLTTSPLIAGICQFLGGIGAAFSFLICITLASYWFPPAKIALAIGLALPLGMLGGVVAETPLTLLNDLIGWRHALQVVAGIGIIILLNAYIFVQDYPKNIGYEKLFTKDRQTKQKLINNFKLLVANKQNWLCGIFTGMLNLPIMVFDSLYGNIYLEQVYHLSSTRASYINTMIFLGTIIGSPLFGLISDRLVSRRIPMLIGAIFSLLVILLVVYSPHLSFIQLITLFFALGLFTSAQIISYPTIVESNPVFVASTATGFASVLIMGSGALSLPLFGWLIKMNWDNKISNGIPVFSAGNYHTALIMLPICFVLSLLAAYFIRDIKASK